MNKLNKGDYVLATKWRDGDPADSWGIGFYDGMRGGNIVRHYVLDADGQQLRTNGFRRVERISQSEGDLIFALYKACQKNYVLFRTVVPSLWNLLDSLRQTKLL